MSYAARKSVCIHQILTNWNTYDAPLPTADKFGAGTRSESMKLPGLSESETSKLIPPNAFLVGYRGSIAHGMYVPSNNPNSIDDKDIMGVCYGPIDSYLGLGHFEQYEKFIGEWDCITYELRKYLRLMLKCNPNVMSLLWLDRHNYIFKDEMGDYLISQRNLFVSKEAYYAFTGYAYSQLKRMTHTKFEGYMGEKRKSLVAKFGYDTKNASHLIRLLRTGIEFLRDGELHVLRHDSSQLLEIKNGEWTLEQVKAEAESLFKRSEKAFDECKLPVKPDPNKVNKLCLTLMNEFIRRECCSIS